MRVTVGIILTMVVAIVLIGILIVMSIINPAVLVGAAGGVIGIILLIIVGNADRGVVNNKRRVR